MSFEEGVSIFIERISAFGDITTDIGDTTRQSSCRLTCRRLLINVRNKREIDIIKFSIINTQIRIIVKLNVVDLFCGCGGLSLGFSQAGFNVIDAYDCWDVAIECYNSNFDHDATRVDLSSVENVVKLINKKDVSLIIGGPPCQDFSSAGVRLENERAALTRSFSEIISKVKPRCFFMENVDLAKKSKAYADARKAFVEAGYGLTELSLDASYYGVPQRRRRFIVVGYLGAKDGFLEHAILNRKSETSLTVREKYPDFEVEFYYRHPRSYSRRGVFSIDEPSPTIRGVNRPLPSGYTFHKGDKVVDEGLRALTSKERALLQTFPADYKWPKVSKQSLDQLIGNAVPVQFAKVIAEEIKKYIEKEKRNHG